MTMSRNASVLAAMAGALFAWPVSPSRAGDAPFYVRKATWHETMVASFEALARSKPEAAARTPLPNFGKGPYTVTAWIRTRHGGTVVAKAPAKGKWVEQGKSIFVAGGKLCYDIGWVGCVRSERRVADGKWHHIAVVGRPPELRFYVDGRRDTTGRLEAQSDHKSWPTKIGYTSDGFGGAFRGELDEVRIYNRALSADEIAKGVGSVTSGLVGKWSFEGSANDESGSGNHAVPKGRTGFAAGKSGKALRLDGSGHLVVPCGKGAGAAEVLWGLVARDFPEDASRQEMAWEREDGIWSGWRAGDLRDLAGRYAKSSLRKGDEARALAARVTGRPGLAGVRKLYLSSRRYGMLLERLGKYNLKGLRQAISCLARKHPESRAHLAKLDAIEEQAANWQESGGDIDTAALAKWKGDLEGLRREALVTGNPLLAGCDKLVFVRRFTYSSNHYYTDYVNSRFSPGGNLCTLSLKTGEVKELAPSLEGGVFGRFDLSFDAERIVFAWKCAAQEGYRIYEVKVDGTGLRQLTFPEKNEAEIVKLYRVRGHYHHGTDDMHPCYLPDGGIVFISTRCRYGILCDGPDDFSTTILYRIDADGKNMEKLTNSAVSEASPSIMNDGRILYTRWEYVDKGAVSVKCLWAMRPDGSMTSEVFGNDIPFPPSLIHGHAIPGHNNLFVLLGAPHYPQNRVGTVIRIDINKPIRTREPMTYITPEIDVKGQGGFSHKNNGGWKGGQNGPLYAEPYPLSPEFHLASYNPDRGWRDSKAYALYMIDEFGNRVLIHRDPEMSCWQARPLRPRETPPVITSPRDPELAKKNLATVVMTDVYAGLEGIERGTVKYVRILEQMPRPWASQRRWGGDCYDQQHAVISMKCALGLKVQHGIVPVEKDGSAHFTVTADRNIYFQALDKDYMEVRRMRTYVYFRPGETRSCFGCHEYRREVPPSAKPLLAMLRPPSKPGPQPGEKTGARPLHYPTDVQPVLDKHCVKCHSGAKPKGNMDLTGTMTNLFCRSYENILRRRLVRIVGENHPKTGNVVMTPPKTWGSHASKLIAHLKKGHSKVKLSQAEWVKLTTFVDSNSQYYGSYYGRRNLKYKGHPNFRPVPTFAQATSTTAPLPEGER